MTNVGYKNNEVLWIPTARSYVLSGLVYHFDGIECGGYGITTVPSGGGWIELVKNLNTLNPSAFQHEDNHMIVLKNAPDNLLTNTDDIYKIVLTISLGNWTLSIIGKGSNSIGGFYDLVGYGSSLCWLSLSTGDIMFGAGTKIVHHVTDTSVFTKYTMSKAGSICRCFINDLCVAVLEDCLSIPPSLIRGYAYFNTSIMQNMFYDRALTDEEVAANYKVDKVRFGI